MNQEKKCFEKTKYRTDKWDNTVNEVFEMYKENGIKVLKEVMPSLAPDLMSVIRSSNLKINLKQVKHVQYRKT